MPSHPLRTVVLMPVRDDWTSAAELIRRLDETFRLSPFALHVLVVDDGSVQGWSLADFQSDFTVVQAIQVLRLTRNLGHQRAIAIGLAYVQKTITCDAILVMDADGEDTPSGALELMRLSVIKVLRRRYLPSGAAASNLLAFGFFIGCTNFYIAF